VPLWFCYYMYSNPSTTSNYGAILHCQCRPSGTCRIAHAIAPNLKPGRVVNLKRQQQQPFENIKLNISNLVISVQLEARLVISSNNGRTAHKAPQSSGIVGAHDSTVQGSQR
jgi:hypothetical protein